MLVEDAVAPAAHAALEDELFFLVRVEARSGTTVNRTRCRAPANVFGVATYSSCDSADSGTEPGSFGDSFTDRYFVGIRLTFVPVADELFLVNTLHIDDRVGVRCAAGQDSCKCGQQ